ELYEESEQRYEQAIEELALFRDTNKGSLTALAETELETLTNKRNLAYSLFSSVASRLEEAKSRMNEDTPIYTTFQDPTFPTESEGANLMILPASIFIGVFLGIGWLFFEKLMLIMGRVFGWNRNEKEPRSKVKKTKLFNS
ncbi:MAG: hypothetical protein WDZ80_07970, partial [Candidatus Paceibacterota bacterium]